MIILLTRYLLGLLTVVVIGQAVIVASQEPRGSHHELIANKQALVKAFKADYPSISHWSTMCDSEPRHFRVVAGWSSIDESGKLPPVLGVAFVEIGPYAPEANSDLRVVIDGRESAAKELLHFFWESDRAKHKEPGEEFGRVELMPFPIAEKGKIPVFAKPIDVMVASYHCHSYPPKRKSQLARPIHEGLSEFLAEHNRFGREEWKDGALSGELRWLFEPGGDPEDVIAVWIDGDRKVTATSPGLGTNRPLIVENLDGAGPDSISKKSRTVELLPKGTIERIRAGKKQNDPMYLFALGREGLVLANKTQSSFEVHLLTGDLRKPADCSYRHRPVRTKGLWGQAGASWLATAGIKRPQSAAESAKLVAWSVCSPAIWRDSERPQAVDPELWAIPPWPIREAD